MKSYRICVSPSDFSIIPSRSIPVAAKGKIFIFIMAK